MYIAAATYSETLLNLPAIRTADGFSGPQA